MAERYDDDGHPVPPPIRIVRKGWFKRRELSRREAEAYHLREAARLAGAIFMSQQAEQTMHLREAERNRIWGRLNIPMPAGTKPPRPGPPSHMSGF